MGIVETILRYIIHTNLEHHTKDIQSYNILRYTRIMKAMHTKIRNGYIISTNRGNHDTKGENNI